MAIVSESHGQKMPDHVGIIMDGNRRFAQRLMLQPWKGHEWGAKKVEDVLEWTHELGIKTTSLYCLSYENFTSRPKNELDMLIKLFEREFSKKSTLEKFQRDNVRAKIIGKTELLPKKLQSILYRLEEETKNNTEYVVNFAIAYGGREEILDAARKIAIEAKKGKIDPKKLNEEVFGSFLLTKKSTDPDLIIRTGGEKRISGFLLWQSAYSELFFTDKMWPDFGKDDLVDALEDYHSRKRRFGK